MTGHEICHTLLACKHMLTFKAMVPNVGEELWCVRCSTYQPVEIASYAWRSRCHDCTYSRTHGLAKIEAELSADKHGRRKPGHHVLVIDGTTTTTHESTPRQLTFGDIPPF